MILCDGNYGLGAYGMDPVHNMEPERSRLALRTVQGQRSFGYTGSKDF